MASHFESCPNVSTASRMNPECTSHASWWLLESNSIYGKNSAEMHFKCRRKLSTAAPTRLECSRNVLSCSRVIVDVIHDTAESFSLRWFFERLQKRSQSPLRICLIDITACRQGRKERSPPKAEVLQPKKLLKSELMLLKMPLHIQSRKLKPRAPSCFQDGNSDRGK